MVQLREINKEIMTISETYQSKITSQSYLEKARIEGVELTALKLHTDDGGNFLEIFRLKNGSVEGAATPFEAQQISMSIMVPGVVKAYHFHKQQDDFWFVPPTHRLLVNMHDLREDSPTYDQHLRLVLGGGSAHTLRIPAGVAHGVKNCYSQDMYLFYATSQQFNPEAPDEYRLPWDAFGSDVWEVAKG